LKSLYKDEVREVGRQLGVPEELLERHPFPGPGLAIRCLCAEADAAVEQSADGWVLPVRSVGVQGDARSYAAVLAIDPEAAGGMDQARERATELVNCLRGVNRVVTPLAVRAPLYEMVSHPSALTPERLTLLRKADSLVRRLSHESGYDRRIWQFPVILIPLGTAHAPESVVLRPVESVDGMTAQSAPLEAKLAAGLSAALMELPELAGVFYDLTHKPPGTIEWE